MKFKKFSIVASIIAALIVIMVVIFGCLKVNNGLSVNDPDSILVYSKSTIANEYTKTDTPKIYGELLNHYKEMTNMTVFDYMLSKNDINTKPTQDLENKYKEWTNVNKQNGYCVEFLYNEKQTVIVSIDGDTKVIEFYSLIMQVSETSGVQNIALYFSTTIGTSKTYSDSPIVVVGKHNQLLNYVRNIK
ncbi:MAG: hypothetical protein IJS74_01990 [Clostridia bacterium]|nr:hypothetical protein [Clostridia bacterium]